MSDQHQGNLGPVVKTRRVPLSAPEAFELFTGDLASWWPMATHSVSGDATATVTFAAEARGVVLETAPDGTGHVWAEVLVVDAPNRLVLAWHPGADAPPASQLDVRFLPAESGCDVRIVQSGWERYGRSGPERRQRYHEGWEHVLAAYEEAARARA